MIILKLATMGLLTMIAIMALAAAPSIGSVSASLDSVDVLRPSAENAVGNLAMRASNDRSYHRDVMHE